MFGVNSSLSNAFHPGPTSNSIATDEEENLGIASAGEWNRAIEIVTDSRTSNKSYCNLVCVVIYAETVCITNACCLCLLWLHEVFDIIMLQQLLKILHVYEGCQ
jgi:hypothetical protein